VSNDLRQSPAVPARNLFLVAYQDTAVPRTLAEVARLVEEEAPDVRARVLDNRRYRLRRYAMAVRPSLYVAFAPSRRLKPLRGKVFRGHSMPKTTQYEVLERHGLPVPRWAPLREDRPADLDGFGPYVVVKPDLGLKGAYVRIMRRERAHWRPMERPLPGGNPDLVVQEFIYTGQWPVTYRVTTLFGEVLYAVRGEGSHDPPPLEARYGFGDGGGGRTICGSSRRSSWTLVEDEDLLALARRAHELFADIPLLGTDIVRDAETGRPYVIETNPGGYTWHFGSAFDLALRERYGLELATQFDGLRRAARILAAKTRTDAC